VNDQHQPQSQPWPPQSTIPDAQPWPAPSTGTRFVSPHDAERSRRWRLSVGIASLGLAVFAGFYTVMNIISVVRAADAIAARGGYVSESNMASAIAIIAVYCVAALGYLAIGIWNILARQSTAAAPVIAAMVLAAIVIVLIVFLLIRSATVGSAPHFGGILTNLLVITRSISILRMKKESTAYSVY
jgi:hypothetical protein